MAKNSAIGPRTSTGKKVSAPTIKIVANQNTPNTTVSVRSVLGRHRRGRLFFDLLTQEFGRPPDHQARHECIEDQRR